MKEIWKKHYPKILAFAAGWVSEVLTDLGKWLKTLLESLAQ